MKKIIGISIAACLVISIISMILNADNRGKDKKGLDKEEKVTSILADNGVINLGNHIVAYRISFGDSGKEERYIAIHALDTDYDSVFYLPDIYEEIYDLRMEGLTSLYISYGDGDDGSVHSVQIPILFLSQADCEIIEWGGNRIFVEGKKDIEERLAELPKTIWRESVTWKGNEYGIKFERTSLIYEMEYGENGKMYADYCLTMHDSEDDIIFRQTITNYPVAYEEVYWLIDFSSDGFPDIAFCVEYDAVERTSGEKNLTTLYIMVCDMENEAYEPKQLPVYGLRTTRPVWNSRHSVISLYCEGILQMYTLHSGKWTNIKDDGCSGILTEEEPFWSNNNMENIALYPATEWWEEVEMTVGGDTASKYVKRTKNGESR